MRLAVRATAVLSSAPEEEAVFRDCWIATTPIIAAGVRAIDCRGSSSCHRRECGSEWASGRSVQKGIHRRRLHGRRRRRRRRRFATEGCGLLWLVLRRLLLWRVAAGAVVTVWDCHRLYKAGATMAAAAATARETKAADKIAAAAASLRCCVCRYISCG